MTEDDATGWEIYVGSGFGMMTQKPFVELRFGHTDGRRVHLNLIPAEARDLALDLLRCAEGANTDGFLVSFFHRRMEMPLERVAPIIQARREFRETKEETDV